MEKYSQHAIAQCASLPQLVSELDTVLRRGEHKAMLVPRRETLLDSRASRFVSMPALSERHGIYLNKVATILERSNASELPTLSAMVLVFSSRDGQPLALLDGAAVTNLKCAAVSALVTDYCAPRNARTLGLIGAGVQARQQVLAVCSVRRIDRIQVYARDVGKRAKLGEDLAAVLPGVELVPCASVDDAIAGADVISTATTSSLPLSDFAGVSAPVHVNCMGAHTPESRELPRSLLERALLVVEDVETAVGEAGAVHRGALELGDLATSDARKLQARLTIFSSTGHACLDVITAAHVLDRLGVRRDGAVRGGLA